MVMVLIYNIMERKEGERGISILVNGDEVAKINRLDRDTANVSLRQSFKCSKDGTEIILYPSVDIESAQLLDLLASLIPS